jgi:SOS response regulatory protein OraA/RecX
MARSLKSYTLALLARREYSRYELLAKMRRYVQRWDLNPNDIEVVLAWLEAHQFQSDARFAAGLVRRRYGQFGDRAIAAELAQHGLEWPLSQRVASRSTACGADDLTNAEPNYGLNFTSDLADHDGGLPSEEERALAWLQRRYACHVHADQEPAERQQLELKAKRALAARGFGFDSIRKAWKSFLSEQEFNS